ncbi:MULTISPECIES: hypothetical protein [Aphanothece]|uniref:hypothetical protein n=1 Tax=Aphanothece TaxID=1121 RepID=UPI0039851970
MTTPSTNTLASTPAPTLHDAREMLYRCILATDSNPMSCEQKEHRWDAVDTYFTCLVACDLLDHSCSTACTEALRQTG